MTERYFASVPNERVRKLSAAMKRAEARLERMNRKMKSTQTKLAKRGSLFAGYQQRWVAFHAKAASSCGAKEEDDLPPLSIKEMAHVLQVAPQWLLNGQCEQDTMKATLHLHECVAKMEEAKEEEKGAVNTQTTLDNATSVRLFAEYFAERGAERVFEDVVRPWCSRAILAPTGGQITTADFCIGCSPAHPVTEDKVHCAKCGGCICDASNAYQVTHVCPRDDEVTPAALDKKIANVQILLAVLGEGFSHYDRALSILGGLNSWRLELTHA